MENESLDIYGTPIDASDPIHDQRLREMTSFPKRLLQQVGVELGNILKEHSSRPIEISYHSDKLAPYRLLQEFIGRIASNVIRYQQIYSNHMTAMTNIVYKTTEQVQALAMAIDPYVEIMMIIEKKSRERIEKERLELIKLSGGGEII
jgi:hypothetical protein